MYYFIYHQRPIPIPDNHIVERLYDLAHPNRTARTDNPTVLAFDACAYAQMMSKETGLQYLVIDQDGKVVFDTEVQLLDSEDIKIYPKS